MTRFINNNYLLLYFIMSSPIEGGNPIDVCRRKALKVSVAALCSEVGYGAAEDIALETLTEK